MHRCTGQCLYIQRSRTSDANQWNPQSEYVTTLTGSGAGVGYSYHNQFEKTEESIQKTVYMISKYYLPKIELSFDYLDSCASDEFVRRIQDALKQDNGSDKSYHELVKLLKLFGHFIPASVTLGGIVEQLQRMDRCAFRQSDFIAVYKALGKAYLCGFNDKRWFIQELLQNSELAEKESHSEDWDGRNKWFAILGVNQ